MEEESVTRKINNSFLRDHNYATEADIISTVEFNPSGELLATGDKGGRVVVFQREQEDEDGRIRDPSTITSLRVPVLQNTDLMVEATARRVFSNAHTYHINSISVNSDLQTYISTDDLRVNLWNLEITDQSFNIVDIKPCNMEDLTEVITAAEFHPQQCNTLAYSSSRGSVRLCDMRKQALCDTHCKFFEEPEDPSTRSFFSEISLPSQTSSEERNAIRPDLARPIWRFRPV
nr:serine/threonine-protein phosphatase 2A 55 kDa regulatory subunit B beta isoform-like [Salvelinus alpinus]